MTPEEHIIVAFAIGAIVGTIVTAIICIRAFDKAISKWSGKP